jgi:tetratricopeptide (TPR) repeat protein
LKKYLLYFILFFAASALHAQDAKFDSIASKGIKEIYNIKFDQAETTFRSLIADYPEHPAGRFFLSMIDWWKILLDLDTEIHDELFFKKLDDVIHQCDDILDRDEENIDALFFKGGAIGFRGRLRAYRESWIKAADDGREALPIVERASNLDPNNVDVQLGFGIYNYYASVIPAEYPLLKPLMIFFPSGDKELGIQQLNNTAERGKYARYEAIYFLMTLYYQYENNPYKAEEYAKILFGEFPDNPLFQRWRGRIAVKRGDLQLSSTIFKDYMQRDSLKFYGFNNKKGLREASYYIGLYHRSLNELDTAKNYFEKSLELSRSIDGGDESGFLINTVLYLGMINDMIGSRSDAVKYYEELLSLREYGQSHSMAKQYLKDPFKN